MFINASLDVVSLHRDLVSAYYHRRSGAWIVRGAAKSSGGAVVLEESGEIHRMCTTECDAAHFLETSIAA